MSDVSYRQKLDWLRLIRSENVGTKTFHDLCSIYKSPACVLERLPELSARGGKKAPLKLCPVERAEQELQQLDKFGAELVLAIEDSYPYLLKQIAGYPPVLSVYGNKSIFNQKKSVAIVGSRSASHNATALAELFARELGQASINVVSGLARGIDTAAHKGALEYATTAIVAGGLDKIYPPENNKLFHAIRQKGAVISEMPMGAVPKACHFPRRNRIISGMSSAIVVVEAAVRSGSLITARMGLEYGRDILAVPGFPLDPRCRGTNKLIKEGAFLVESSSDIIDILGVDVDDSPQHIFSSKQFDLKADDNTAIDESDLDSLRPVILGKLSSGLTSIDELIMQVDMPASNMQAILLELELAGKLTRYPGNKVMLKML